MTGAVFGIERLLAAPPWGAGLTPEQALAWARSLRHGSPAEADDPVETVEAVQTVEAVETVLAWLAAGLPADPPPQLSDFLDEHLTPPVVAAWLAAGFDLPAVARLCSIPLDAALHWQAAGLTPDQIQAVVQADPTLEPAELAAFEAAGIGWPERLAWIGYGFDAAGARRWRQLGLSAGQARLWRSVGRDPDDAVHHLAAGAGTVPPGLQAGWFSMGSDRSARNYGIVDPPGTRGRAASEPSDMPRYRRWSPPGPEDHGDEDLSSMS